MFKFRKDLYESMERLSNLFFELSHENRLDILTILQTSPRKLTQLATKMGDSSQEVYRHLSRLLDTGLVAKTVEGDYVITSYGLQVMRLVSGYDFLTKHSVYFLSRDLSSLPEEFSLRIGQLENSMLVNDVMITIFDIETMVRDAEEYVWIMLDQMLMSLYDPLLEALDRGVEVRVMRPKGWRLDDQVVDRLDKETFNAIVKKIREGAVQQREPEEIPVVIALSEKEVASLSFLPLDGKHDYVSFKSSYNDTVGWCKELFLYYWERASSAPVRSQAK